VGVRKIKLERTTQKSGESSDRESEAAKAGTLLGAL
jgi:hypothetical protein